MDANQLLFYLRGVFENTVKPTKLVWENVRDEVLQATPVEQRVIPVPVTNPQSAPSWFGTQKGCGCSGDGGETPPPVLQVDKL